MTGQKLRALDWLYMTRQRAQGFGFTHEGRLFGVPAWFVASGKNDPEPLSCPKIPVLQAWCVFADVMADTILWILPASVEFEALHIDRAIDAQVVA